MTYTGFCRKIFDGLNPVRSTELTYLASEWNWCAGHNSPALRKSFTDHVHDLDTRERDCR
jgi:hypothetical protein